MQVICGKPQLYSYRASFEGVMSNPLNWTEEIPRRLRSSE